MGKIFKTSQAFRTSLEQRLKQLAKTQGLQLNSLRLKVAIERLLARLFDRRNPPWLLKGGYAMELRYRPRARATKDVDLSVKTSEGELRERLERIHDELQEAADRDLKDFFSFRVAAPSAELQGAPDGGARFPIASIVAGKPFARFHLDLGFGDPLLSAAEELIGQDFLDFAGVSPAKARAIPKQQQFAEKLHAYTLPWMDRPNTRSKDLVDLVLFVTIDPPDKRELFEAVEATFRIRNSHTIPDELPPPPESWRAAFAAMAQEANLEITNFHEGFRLVQEFWRAVLANQ